LDLIVENQNNTPVNLKIKHQLYYDGNCVTCDNEEYNFKYQLDAKEKVGKSEIDKAMKDAKKVYKSLKNKGGSAKVEKKNNKTAKKRNVSGKNRK
jgi:predicted DCC family thiol-disulfide oxidoreductase YuxK